MMARHEGSPWERRSHEPAFALLTQTPAHAGVESVTERVLLVRVTERHRFRLPTVEGPTIFFSATYQVVWATTTSFGTCR